MAGYLYGKVHERQRQRLGRRTLNRPWLDGATGQPLARAGRRAERCRAALLRCLLVRRQVLVKSTSRRWDEWLATSMAKCENCAERRRQHARKQVPVSLFEHEAVLYCVQEGRLDPRRRETDLTCMSFHLIPDLGGNASSGAYGGQYCRQPFLQ